ncbi:MAG: hypothetical protein CSB55_00350 [Candidatus Cloacimonadota bacterium]|nr:MAG: hypothetical protein CSB55_00350 [Candidatus Cloacimonadota bacterium]
MTDSELKEYYFLFREDTVVNQKGGQKSIVSDENGIPMNPTYIDVKDKDYVYFPITIGQVGLAVFHTYLQTKSEEDKERFLKFPRWFADNAEISEELGAIWRTDVSLPQYKNPGSWQSAFVQSRAISVLLRGYQLTGNKKWLELAEQALLPYTVGVKDGGVTSFTPFGPFYEEYTAEFPVLVLNGMIFAMCGLHDFIRVCPENRLAQKLYDAGICTLRKIIPEYDLKFWTKYNLCEADFYPEFDPATIAYQHLHITQMNFLYKLTGESVFKKYAGIFKKQISFFNVIKMYFYKYKALKKTGRI